MNPEYKLILGSKYRGLQQMYTNNMGAVIIVSQTGTVSFGIIRSAMYSILGNRSKLLPLR